LDDFDRHTRVGRKALTRAHKVLKSTLRVNIPVSLPEQYIERYGGLLGLPPTVIGSTYEVLKLAREIELTHGKSPTGLAAAAIYIASRQSESPRTQREIADISGVTEVTIRNRYKEIVAGLNIKLD